MLMVSCNAEITRLGTQSMVACTYSTISAECQVLCGRKGLIQPRPDCTGLLLMLNTESMQESINDRSAVRNKSYSDC